MNQTTSGQTTDQRGVSHVGCNGGLGGRAKRRIEAEEKRRAWRIAWINAIEASLRAGKSTPESFAALAPIVDAQKKQHPQQASEIDRALDELLQSVSSAIARQSATPPNASVSHEAGNET